MNGRLGLVAALATVAACGSSSKHAANPYEPLRTITAKSSSTATGPPSTTPRSSTSGASNVRLPATFTIGAGGKLSPPIISAPAGVTIELTMISGDGKAHRVSVKGLRLSVAAGGRASVRLTGLRRGRYAVVVDGAGRGALIVGAQPGP